LKFIAIEAEPSSSQKVQSEWEIMRLNEMIVMSFSDFKSCYLLVEKCLNVG